MTISSIGSQLSLSALTSGSTQQRKVPGHFEAVSELLGESAEDLAAKVAGGQSLADIATEKGVSSEDLLSALEENAPDDLKASGNLREIVTQIAEQSGPMGPGGPGGPGGPPPGPPPSGATGTTTGTLTSTQQDTLDTLSSLLEMDSDDVLTELQSGTSLTDLLAEHDVDITELASKLQSNLQVGFQVDLKA